jgi:hypothetical protein
MSGTAVLEPRAVVSGPGPGARAILVLALAGAILFVVLAALPYFTFLFVDAPNPFVSDISYKLYFPKRGWLLLHIVGGMLAVLAGPVQLWLGLSDRRMDLHRRLGYVYIGGVALGVVGAVVLAVQTDLGSVFGAGLLGLATAWVMTTGLAFASIRRGLMDQHKEWMIRSYVVTFAFVMFRVGDLGMRAAGFSDVLQNIAFLAWASWVLPLLVTEGVLQGRKIFAVAR